MIRACSIPSAMRWQCIYILCVIGVGYIARMVFWLLQQPDAVAEVGPLARNGWAMLQSQGRQMNKDGGVLTDPEENLAHLRALMQEVLNEQLPVWRQLGML